jgi:hypothetical protein
VSTHEEVRRKLDELRKKKSVTARELLPLLAMMLDADPPKPATQPHIITKDTLARAR